MLLKQKNQENNSNQEFSELKKAVSRLQKIVFLLLVGLFSMGLYSFFVFSTPIKNQVLTDTRNDSPKRVTENKLPQAIALPQIEQKVTFAGETVPYADFEVRERIDREILGNTFSHSRTFLVMKRAGRWFPIIEPILKENQVPDDLKYVAVIESDLGNVVSPSGAAGFWQFMKNTGPEFGLEISEEVDERYHIEKATKAACDYFKKAYAKFDSWTLAAASYNMGMNGVAKRLEDQKQTSYYDLDLNNETSRYVARILAVKTIFSNPNAYGFSIQNQDLYPRVPTKTMLVDYAIPDLNQFAIENGTNLKILKELNPWLIKSALTNAKKKTYAIKIPEGGFNYQQAQKNIEGILPN